MDHPRGKAQNHARSGGNAWTKMFPKGLDEPSRLETAAGRFLYLARTIPVSLH
jgi:hypothetical protein